MVSVVPVAQCQESSPPLLLATGVWKPPFATNVVAFVVAAIVATVAATAAVASQR